MKTCTFENCDRPLRSKGLCIGHSSQRRRGKPLTPLRQRRPIRFCKVCEEPAQEKGMCFKHAQQMRRHGKIKEKIISLKIVKTSKHINPIAYAAKLKLGGEWVCGPSYLVGKGKKYPLPKEAKQLLAKHARGEEFAEMEIALA